MDGQFAMATTLTAFHSVGTALSVTPVGHSRCDFFRSGALSSSGPVPRPRR
jgi:hypothetical protein